MELNYCPSCGEDLPETNSTSCNTPSSSELDDGFGLLKQNIDLDEIDLRGDNSEGRKHMEMWQEAIAEQLEKNDITVEDLEDDHMFTYLLVDEILKRSAKIKLDLE